jgi:pilus assembly protein Flp/PilA
MSVRPSLTWVVDGVLVSGGKAGDRLSPTASTVDPAGERENQMTKFISKFMSDESGATAIEYGLIAALIAVVIISAVTALGTTIKEKFTAVVDGMNAGTT